MLLMKDGKLHLMVEKLEKLTGKKVNLQEQPEITKQFKKRFYGVTADFDREAKRVLAFFEANAESHPDLKPLVTRFKRLMGRVDEVFTHTELYLDSPKANQPLSPEPFEQELAEATDWPSNLPKEIDFRFITKTLTINDGNSEKRFGILTELLHAKEDIWEQYMDLLSEHGINVEYDGYSFIFIPTRQTQQQEPGARAATDDMTNNSKPGNRPEIDEAAIEYRFKKGDRVISVDGEEGTIKDYNTSYLDGKTIPSYWVVFDCFKDGQARNAWERSLSLMGNRSKGSKPKR